MTVKYMVYGENGEEKTFKSIAAARKFAYSNMHVPNVEIRDVYGLPIGVVFSIRQDNPERNKVYIYKPAYRDYRTDKVSLFSKKTGEVTFSFQKGVI